MGLRERVVCMDCLIFGLLSKVLFSEKVKPCRGVELSFVKRFFFVTLKTFDRDLENLDFLACFLCVHKKRHSVYVLE